MRVRCIDNLPPISTFPDRLVLNAIYEVYAQYEGYAIVGGSGFVWSKSRFEPVEDILPDGQHFCKCGTITTNINSVCCDCKVSK
jgi:hypothetical protein